MVRAFGWTPARGWCVGNDNRVGGPGTDCRACGCSGGAGVDCPVAAAGVLAGATACPVAGRHCGARGCASVRAGQDVGAARGGVRSRRRASFPCGRQCASVRHIWRSSTWRKLAGGCCCGAERGRCVRGAATVACADPCNCDSARWNRDVGSSRPALSRRNRNQRNRNLHSRSHLNDLRFRPSPASSCVQPAH